MAEHKDIHSSSPTRTPKLQLAAEPPSTWECWIPPKIDIPHPRAKAKSQQDGRRGEITFRIKHLTHQTCSEGSNKSCVHQDPDTPWRLNQNCVWVPPAKVPVSSGLLQGQGLWVQQSWVWHKPFWRRLPLTPPSELTGLGKQNLGGHKQNLVHTKTQEKGAVTPQDTDPDLPVSVQESLGESWVNSGLPQGWGPWVWQCVHGNFERGYYLHSL